MGLNKEIESLFESIAFAEAGEFETARQIIKEGREVKMMPKAPFSFGNLIRFINRDNKQNTRRTK